MEISNFGQFRTAPQARLLRPDGGRGNKCGEGYYTRVTATLRPNGRVAGPNTIYGGPAAHVGLVARPHRRRPENSVLCPPSHSHVWAAAVGIFGPGPFIKPPAPTDSPFISTQDQQPHAQPQTRRSRTFFSP